MEPQTPSKIKKSIMGFFQIHRIVVICIVFLTILLISAGLYYGYELFGKIQPFYTVVVDCGSTGTRANAYKWKLNDENNKNLPILLGSYPHELDKKRNGCEYHCMQTEPGLHKFVGNYSGVRSSLVPLLRWIEKIIPNDRHRDTPIFVLATAGLRRLQVEDSRKVLEDVEWVIREHPFKWRREWIRVLSGREEAYYGWVALNYKLGYLDSSELPTLGLLDLGGSSLQVVMEVDEVRNDSDVLVSKIGLVEHKLKAYSLPAFGLNEASDRAVSMLIQLDDGGYDVRHPCLSSRFLGNYTCSGCSERDSLRTLVGDPNWERCKILVQATAMNISIAEWSEPRLVSSCLGRSLNEGRGILNIAINTASSVHYHALSGFFVVYNTLNFSAKANLTEIWETSRHLCSRIWVNENTNINSQYCFKALYLASLIEDGLCLGNASITFGPGDISWTLGASLVEAEGLWRTLDGPKTMALTPQSMLSPIFVFVILAVLLFIVYYCQVQLPMLRRRSVGVEMPLPSYTHTKHRPH